MSEDREKGRHRRASEHQRVRTLSVSERLDVVERLVVEALVRMFAENDDVDLGREDCGEAHGK